MAIKLTTTDDVLGNKRGVEVVPTVEDVFGILQKGFKNLINAYYASYYFGLTKEATLGLLGVANGPYSPKTLAEQAGLDTSDPNKQITIFDFASGKLAENPRYGYFTAKVSDTAWDTSSSNFTSILEPGTTEPKNGCEIGITCFFVDIAQNNGSNKLGGSANWSQGTKRWDIYPDNEVVIDNDTIIDVEGKIAVALSLHNAEGRDSIIQKYTGRLDVLHFENTSTGESAAVLGESNSNAGNRNLVEGKLNVITADTANSIIAGLGNGRGGNSSPSLSPIAGNNILLVGLNNQSKKNSSGITPDNNIIGGESNVVIGIKNSLVVGFDNHPAIAANNSITAGSHNYNLAQSALVIGDNLYSTAPDSLTLGTWNSPNENYRLTIGNGTDDSHRSNAFVVTNTGIARAYGAISGDNDLTPKKYVDGLFADLNIENGTGQDSLVQKYTGDVDATRFGNTNTGESATVFGESNENNANRVLMGGKLNRTSTKQGVQNAKESLIVGLGNGRGIGTTPEIDGIEGMALIIAGSNNTNIKDDRIGAPNPDNAIVSGLNNVNKGREAVVSGFKVINLGMRSIVVGEQLINNYDYKAVFGKFNESKPDTLFEIGNGTAGDARSNAFEVTKTGIARAYGTPSGNNDLVTKGFSDTYYAANEFATDADMDALFGISTGSVVSPIQNGGDFVTSGEYSGSWL